MAQIKGIINAKGKASSGGGGHANLRTYEASIVKDLNEPNVYHLDLSQAYIIDLATGMTPESYNAGDIVYACMPDGNSEDEIENIYVVNRVDNSTDLILQSKMPVRHLILTTSTDATYSNSEYTLDFTELDETPNINDYVAYINNGAISTLYQVASIDWADEYVVLTKICDIGGGESQLYQHNILMSWTDSLNNKTGKLTAQIISSDDTPFTMATLRAWLKEKGFTGGSSNTTNVYALTGQIWWYSKNILIYGMYINPNDSDLFYMVGYENARQGNLETAYNNYLSEPTYSNLNFVDAVIPL